eukprot:scaffold2803_cov347-Prasinococcus_capsulatus_cf.AAC.7
MMMREGFPRMVSGGLVAAKKAFPERPVAAAAAVSPPQQHLHRPAPPWWCWLAAARRWRPPRSRPPPRNARGGWLPARAREWDGRAVLLAGGPGESGRRTSRRAASPLLPAPACLPQVPTAMRFASVRALAYGAAAALLLGTLASNAQEEDVFHTLHGSGTTNPSKYIWKVAVLSRTVEGDVARRSVLLNVGSCAATHR